MNYRDGWLVRAFVMSLIASFSGIVFTSCGSDAKPRTFSLSFEAPGGTALAGGQVARLGFAFCS